MTERGILVEWVERVLAAPHVVEDDPSDPGLRRAYGSIAEFDGRVLRVVYDDGPELRVVMAFFDRARRLRQGEDQP